MTPTQAAPLLNISRFGVLKAIREGRLKATPKPPYEITVADIEAFKASDRRRSKPGGKRTEAQRARMAAAQTARRERERKQ